MASNNVFSKLNKKKELTDDERAEMKEKFADVSISSVSKSIRMQHFAIQTNKPKTEGKKKQLLSAFNGCFRVIWVSWFSFYSCVRYIHTNDDNDDEEWLVFGAWW